MPVILETQNLTKRFGDLVAVNDLSFEVQEGEIFGIAGPNGAGKTTLFNLISGVYQGMGHIVFDGRRIDRLRPHQICHRGLARTFQISTVFPSLTVYENVKVGAHFGSPSNYDRSRIEETLAQVGLAGKAGVKAENLPLFDKKMTMLAATLATRPKLLMVDEPIGGLSPTEIEETVSLFKRINQEMGITLIVIEHVMKVLMGLSDRMMILHNGAKICIGSPQEVAGDRQVIEVYLGAEYA